MSREPGIEPGFSWWNPWRVFPPPGQDQRAYRRSRTAQAPEHLPTGEKARTADGLPPVERGFGMRLIRSTAQKRRELSPQHSALRPHFPMHRPHPHSVGLSCSLVHLVQSHIRRTPHRPCFGMLVQPVRKRSHIFLKPCIDNPFDSLVEPVAFRAIRENCIRFAVLAIRTRQGRFRRAS